MCPRRARQSDPTASAHGRRPAGGTDAVEASRTDEKGDAEARVAAAERAVRDALRLPREGAVDPADVEKALRSPALREAAKAAAAPGSDAAAALARTGPDAAETLARDRLRRYAL